jgi:hypothetical protein
MTSQQHSPPPSGMYSGGRKNRRRKTRRRKTRRRKTRRRKTRRRKTRRNKGRQSTPYSEILYLKTRKKQKKKHCGKYYKGVHGIHQKTCKKDPKCIYSDQGSGGEWCFTKKRKYTKRKKTHKQ